MNKRKIAKEFIESLNNPYEMYRLINEIDPETLKIMNEISLGIADTSEKLCPLIPKADLFNTALITGYLLKDHIRRAELDELKGKGLY